MTDHTRAFSRGIGSGTASPLRLIELSIVEVIFLSRPSGTSQRSYAQVG